MNFLMIGIPLFLFLFTPIVLSSVSVSGQTQAGTPTATTTTIQGSSNSPANLQFLPQKAYVVPLPPEGQGISSDIFNSQSNGGGITGAVIGAIGLASGLYAKFSGDKKSQANAQTSVRLASVQQGTLEQLYENMPNKGNEITNKPEIKLSNLESIKAEALKNAAKA